jgi:adenylate cyclase class 2
MPTEIEAKFRLSEPQALRDALRRCGARPLGIVLETNRFYDWPDERLRREDRGLRIRVAQPTEGADAVVTVTYKGPRQSGPYKQREENEFTTSDPESVAEVFQGLGLACTLTFQKRRESWQLNACRIELDQLPQLGWFVEIEGPDVESIAATAGQLELSNENAEREPYTVLLSRAMGLSVREFLF